MGVVTSKSIDEPDEVISLPNLQGQILVLGSTYLSRIVHQPGWRWSKDVKRPLGPRVVSTITKACFYRVECKSLQMRCPNLDLI